MRKVNNNTTTNKKNNNSSNSLVIGRWPQSKTWLMVQSMKSRQPSQTWSA